ncbi:MAG: heavy metal translocating P-type ATPase [Rhodobacterales bacterium]
MIPLPDIQVAAPLKDATIILSLPTIHCAGCISAVERGLNATPGVAAARVNLSLKRVAVTAALEVTAEGLIERLRGIGYEAYDLDPGLLAEAQGDAINRGLLMRLAVAGFAMMNVMLLSVAVWAGAEAATRDMLHWISALIALPTIAFSAQPFFGNAWSALKVQRLNMDVPISLAILMAASMSLYETTQHGAYAYFDAALSLTFFLLAGRYLDYRTRASARSAAQELAAMEVPRALKLMNGREVLTAVADLAVGDIVAIKPGTRVPVDGVILTGESEVDRAFLTGESLPAYAGPNTLVSAGEINLTGPLTMRVTACSRDSALQKVAELVALAETSRNKYTSLADRAASIYAPGVHLLAAIAFAGWWAATGDLRLALNIAIAVLIITCPCALGLAVPAVTTAASGHLFRKGVLLKSSTALERLAEVDTVLFDKTGTLTLGTPALDAPEKLRPADLAIAARLAAASAHPLAKAITASAGNLAVTGTLSDIHEIPGHGIEAQLAGEIVRLGRASWVGANPVAQTATYLKVGAAPAVALTFTDNLRPEMQAAIAQLTSLGMKVQLVTGDAQTAAGNVAQRLGITHVLANALPKDKIALVESLTAGGRKVLMVGDGFNDTGALTAAHVSISPASAIDAARVASDIVILGQSLMALGDCVKTARSARRRITENFALAAVYNAVAVPFALIGLATPLMAALAMSASSITVTLNAWRLR